MLMYDRLNNIMNTLLANIADGALGVSCNVCGGNEVIEGKQGMRIAWLM